MPFTNFKNGEIILASEINLNFDYIRAGDMLPRGGISLSNTDSIYDLGSQVYKYNEVNLNEMNFDGVFDKTIDLISEITLSGAVSSIEFSGLNGDGESAYIINAYGILDTTSASYVSIILNGDSESNNYGLQVFSVAGNAVSAARFSSFGGLSFSIISAATTTSKVFTSKLLLYSKTGSSRAGIAYSCDSIDDKYIDQWAQRGVVWNNSSDTITSIKIINSGGDNFLTNTNIQLWAVRV